MGGSNRRLARARLADRRGGYSMLNTAKLVGFVPTTDFKKAKAFYEGVLGLSVVSQDSFAMVLDSNGTMIRVTKVANLTAFPFTILGWDVPDIEAAVTELTQKGVKFEQFGMPGQDDRGIWTAPGGAKVAWFKDPGENVLSITQFA